MSTTAYRVESNFPISGPLLPGLVTAKFFNLVDQTLAVVLASKSFTRPLGQEIRVVHVPSGQVVYRKTAAALNTPNDDF